MLKLICETERLVLREFVKSDWKAVHEYAKDPEVVKFMEWGPNSADETVNFIESALSFQREKPRHIYELAVTLKSDQSLIGACGIRVRLQDPEQAEIGYCFNRKFWRQGYGAEACKAIIAFGFQKLSLHRIIATCDANNFGSAGVMRSSSMRQEASFKKDKKIRGVWRDTLLFGILQEEWLQL